ncbi:ATP-dependent 6-phosphofructokinase 5, chloroplastic [Coccomyxa sp. Obi]|nr:ATP-dependent 6-phosphofructokinase 5, chloroplastic [Coccomyxa sp. Obi]
MLYDPDDILDVKSLRDQLTPRDSPFVEDNNSGGGFVGDKDVVALEVSRYESDESSGAGCVGIYNSMDGTCMPLPPWARRAGPRKTIYHDPRNVTAAVVTCGGLCPGLNDVIQNIVFTLLDYGVQEDAIFGIKYGLRGFYSRNAKPVELNAHAVEGIHLRGGTILGTSRGGADIKEIVRRLSLWGVNMLFVVGGNGGNAAANAIQEECEAQKVLCTVVGVPKSIDNDILLIDKCFGFDTAVEEAQHALLAAKVEASSASNGVGLVRLMGRQSGFIAMQASMASGVVDVCLIPEIDFQEDKLMACIEKILGRKGHAVVCVAEGAGQTLLANSHSHSTDASGNPILADIGIFLRDRIKKLIKDADVKLIDPSYLIRAVPTNPNDRIYCKILGQGAVHGAFAGFTGFTVGLVNTHYVYLPIPVIIQAARTVDPKGRSWNRLKTAINQPDLHD